MKVTELVHMLQGSVLAQITFAVLCISDMDEGVNTCMSLFIDDAKLRRVNRKEDCEMLQQGSEYGIGVLDGKWNLTSRNEVLWHLERANKVSVNYKLGNETVYKL